MYERFKNHREPANEVGVSTESIQTKYILAFFVTDVEFLCKQIIKGTIERSGNLRTLKYLITRKYKNKIIVSYLFLKIEFSTHCGIFT